MRVSLFRNRFLERVDLEQTELASCNHLSIMSTVEISKKLTLIRPIFECRHVALNRLECFACALDVFYVGVPFGCFLGEARVIKRLVRHDDTVCCGRSAEIWWCNLQLVDMLWGALEMVGEAAAG
jgi:hypothetical protein